MRKVLIISYYWPPAGGGGVQRWLKFTKYLPEFGWSPIIYTPSNADYPLKDPSLEADVAEHTTVIRKPIREVRRMYRSFLGRGGKDATADLDQLFYRDASRRSWKQELGLWVRSNCFIPDARVWWVDPSVRFLRTFIRDKGIDTVVTTGPPHSMHLIGLQLKQRFDELRWVADFRDPWTAIEYYDRMPLTRRADRRHRRLERLVLQAADAVITVSPSWAKMLSEIRSGAVHTVTNGFDTGDFSGPAPALDERTTICHVGTLAMDRNPVKFWRGLAEAMHIEHKGNSSIQVKLLGSTDPGVLEILTELGLDYIDHGYVDHERAINEMRSAHVLLLLVNAGMERNALGRIPGKLFEYLAAGRPVIGICPANSDTARLLQEHQHLVLDPDEVIPGDLLARFLNNSTQPPETDIEKFSRSYLAGKVAKVLDGTSAKIAMDK